MTYSFLLFFVKVLNLLLPIKKNLLVFGSDYGHSYREGSKYLMEYIVQYHQEYDCVFITFNKSVKNELQKRGYKCALNISLMGFYYIARAKAVFTTQYVNDISFCCVRRGRKFFYLVHGQPYKIAIKALDAKLGRTKITVVKKSRIRRIWDYLVLKNRYKEFTFDNVSFVAAASDYLRQYMQLDFGKDMDVRVLEPPRNDALFDAQRMMKEKWVSGLDGKFVITYMPTHRLYGKGALTPMPFINKPDFLQWMRENDVVLLMKQHPNMIPQLKEQKNDLDVIIDITCGGYDPQVCIYHSDVLITDYSSVWIDYLLLRRPVLFYIYDDFETNDAGCHYDIKLDPPGTFCYSEEELFNAIKECKNQPDSMVPSDRIVGKYHKFNNCGNFCKMYFEEVQKELN